MSCSMIRHGLAVALALSVNACVPFGDPVGPAAEGDVALDASIDASAYTTLHLAAFPDEGELDVAMGIPESEELVRDQVPLSDVSFPHAYRHGRELGTTDSETWRIVAWLSSDAMSTAPATGDAYGTRTFTLDSCGRYGGYCDTTGGVDFTIDSVVP